MTHNPNKPPVTLSLRLPVELHERIKRDADTPGRRTSIAQWIRNACEEVLEKRKAERNG